MAEGQWTLHSVAAITNLYTGTEQLFVPVGEAESALHAIEAERDERTEQYERALQAMQRRAAAAEQALAQRTRALVEIEGVAALIQDGIDSWKKLSPEDTSNPGYTDAGCVTFALANASEMIDKARAALREAASPMEADRG